MSYLHVVLDTRAAAGCDAVMGIRSLSSLASAHALRSYSGKVDPHHQRRRARGRHRRRSRCRRHRPQPPARVGAASHSRARPAPRNWRRENPTGSPGPRNAQQTRAVAPQPSPPSCQPSCLALLRSAKRAGFPRERSTRNTAVPLEIPPRERNTGTAAEKGTLTLALAPENFHSPLGEVELLTGARWFISLVAKVAMKVSFAVLRRRAAQRDLTSEPPPPYPTGEVVCEEDLRFVQSSQVRTRN